MIPDFQSLMRPVLEISSEDEISIADAVKQLADKLSLSEQDRNERLPSGQKQFANRVSWAKSYLKQAGLVEATKRGHFRATEGGKDVLADTQATINIKYLQQFEEFQNSRFAGKQGANAEAAQKIDDAEKTPDETLRKAYKLINDELVSELLDQVRGANPYFFEKLVVELLRAMGYGGYGVDSEDAVRKLGGSGDGGVDGVIDQDTLGVDQIYIQAKRYDENNSVGPGAVQAFSGALNGKKAQKGIFVTTSSFTAGAKQAAQDATVRIVLIDGLRLAELMIEYGIGCREEQTISLKKVDEGYFE